MMVKNKRYILYWVDFDSGGGEYRIADSFKSNTENASGAWAGALVRNYPEIALPVNSKFRKPRQQKLGAKIVRFLNEGR